MKFITISFLVLTVSTLNASSNNDSCMDSLNKLKDNLGDFIDSYKMDKEYPDLYILEDALESATQALKICINVSFDLTRYDVCVEKLTPVFIILVILKEAWDIHDLENLLLELRSLYLYTYGTIIPCLKSPSQSQTVLMRVAF